MEEYPFTGVSHDREIGDTKFYFRILRWFVDPLSSLRVFISFEEVLVRQTKVYLRDW